jgi:hypothetical protein
MESYDNRSTLPDRQDGLTTQAPKKKWPFIVGAFFVVILGVLTAWFISSNVLNGQRSNKGVPGVKVTSTEAGKLDPNIKYDTATGVLQEGGLNGEGTYQLVREGGVTKTVALTSSMINLSPFVSKKVTIWGETISSKRPGGWLMDVAKIQVTE